MSFQRKETERKKKIPFLQSCKTCASFAAESYPGLILFIMNYMVVIYLSQVFKKFARLMKNA